MEPSVAGKQDCFRARAVFSCSGSGMSDSDWPKLLCIYKFLGEEAGLPLLGLEHIEGIAAI
ncbi:hypothetical protein, partial [Paenibacillus dendritiformis]|uniref:hypothetical protein n=1 Tax=Paenibacillus dendritiformis TaxID=130049 RepID=UPI000DB85E03